MTPTSSCGNTSIEERANRNLTLLPPCQRILILPAIAPPIHQRGAGVARNVRTAGRCFPGPSKHHASHSSGHTTHPWESTTGSEADSCTAARLVRWSPRVGHSQTIPPSVMPPNPRGPRATLAFRLMGAVAAADIAKENRIPISSPLFGKLVSPIVYPTQRKRDFELQARFCCARTQPSPRFAPWTGQSVLPSLGSYHSSSPRTQTYSVEAPVLSACPDAGGSRRSGMSLARERTSNAS